MAKKSQYTLAELVDGLDVTIKGDPNFLIRGVSPIHNAESDRITFVNTFLTKKYRQYLAGTKAGAVILTEADAAECPVNAIITRNPYYIYAKVAALFDDQAKAAAGVHSSVVCHAGAEVDPTASIGAYSVIGHHAKIGANVVIGAGSVIGDHVEIGEDTQLDANVTIYHKVKIGKRTRIASGVVIGADGFGFANQQGAWHKVPQLGTVEIGDDVDIGANTTIDRGALENTVIENGVKLDNLIQIGHNVRIGENTIIAGCVGIAGSAVIGKHCMIGGGSLIIGHITICDKAVIMGGSGVEKSVTEPGMYASGVLGITPFQQFSKNNARFYRLESLFERVKTLENALQELTARKET